MACISLRKFKVVRFTVVLLSRSRRHAAGGFRRVISLLSLLSFLARFLLLPQRRIDQKLMQFKARSTMSSLFFRFFTNQPIAVDFKKWPNSIKTQEDKNLDMYVLRKLNPFCVQSFEKS